MCLLKPSGVLWWLVPREHSEGLAMGIFPLSLALCLSGRWQRNGYPGWRSPPHPVTLVLLQVRIIRDAFLELFTDREGSVNFGCILKAKSRFGDTSVNLKWIIIFNSKQAPGSNNESQNEPKVHLWMKGKMHPCSMRKKSWYPTPIPPCKVWVCVCTRLSLWVTITPHCTHSPRMAVDGNNPSACTESIT